MTTAAQPKEKKPLTFFNLPWYIFLIIAVIVFGATYLGVLPLGMTGCFAFMIVLGAIFSWIGDHTPIIKSYLGGGAIVCIFGAALLVYFHILPAAFDPRVGPAVAKAVAQAARDSGVARI